MLDQLGVIVSWSKSYHAVSIFEPSRKPCAHLQRLKGGEKCPHPNSCGPSAV